MTRVAAGSRALGLWRHAQHWRHAQREMLALGIAGLVVVAGCWLADPGGSRSRSAVDAAGHENTILRARQEALRGYAFDLSGRVSEMAERERDLLDQIVLLGVAHQLDPAGEPELAHEVGAVVLDGAHRDAELGGGLPVGVSLGE